MYEKQVGEKNREPGVKITATSYRASIDDSYLRMFLTAHWIQADSIKDITENQLKECVKARASYEPKDHELRRIDRVVKGVKMDLSLKEGDDRVWSLHDHYISVLEAAGMPDLPDKKPHIAIKHITNRIKPGLLKRRMKDIVLWRKDEQFDKKDFGAFMRELAVQAKKLEHEQESRYHREDSDSGASSASSESEDEGSHSRRPQRKHSSPKKGKKKNHKGIATKKRDNDGAAKQESPNHRKKRVFEMPDCLNPKCDGKHFVADCPISSEEEKRIFKEEYHARKKRIIRFNTDKNPAGSSSKHKGSIRRLGAQAIDDHSALFSATFALGAVESVVMADQGSDANVLPPTVLDALKKATPGLAVEELKPPHSFDFLDQSSGIVCHKRVVADVQVRIRHGTKLVLRNITWHVSDAPTKVVVIGRRVLQAIGCDNKAMLAASCDKNDGVINIPEALAADKAARASKGTIAALVDGGVFHSDEGGEEVDALDESGVYVDIGEDSEKDRDAELESAVQRAQQQGLSDSGANTLRQIIDKHRAIFD